MKKGFISILLIAAMIFTLASCGAKSADDAMNFAPTYDADGGDYLINNSKSEAEMIPEMSTGTIAPEDYGKFIENKFISTEEENVSTFSADVDTASYAYFRNLVNSGYSLRELIATAGNSIRTEEMVNYFDYNYPAPKDGELFSTTARIADCPWNEEAKLLVLGLQADYIEAAQKNNLVFLIDVSGSMNSPNKLELLKKAFSHLTDKLGEDDTVSIVTYSGKEAVVLEGCSGSKQDKILKAVNSLNAKGSTNGEAGLKKAYQIAEEYYIKGGNNRIILASDGDLNVGISSVEELESFVTEKRNSGVFLSVLGFGTGNYKDAKMETIADCGNGVYYYIDSESEAEKVFGADIFSTLYTVAKDVKLQLTFNPDYVESYRLVGYENRLLNKEDFEDDTKDAGELGAGHNVTVCYELIFADKNEQTDGGYIMELDVRYKEPDGEKSKLEEYNFGIEVLTDKPDDNFKFITAVIETSMIIHDSEYIGEITLEDVKAQLDELKLSSDEYKEQFRTLIQSLINNNNKFNK
ncbi:MAG: VWA domain-containing protein [Clostridia bacterium]|nr:VWA domain-containing protein [Clostridia bacterium]